MTMARGTVNELNKYSMLKCGCKGKDWDAKAEADVSRFARVGTSFRWISDINGNVAGSWGSFFFADPDALSRKPGALGLQR